ncbi:helix-turn-helix domain-containing protein [Flavobacterium wongokense]|uniref:helix-turn-helix domain-containing protein n=1 Tax=Flavobacterium wongokense TaxID=2910674 RepID=UPI001F1F62EF|nr:helix-turn-helix domain-containing protein [Flavobacterium sp. WG47]MCF6132933.1 helix-turn-helix domain-containing protein [Flavobacterium sp. WG47]
MKHLVDIVIYLSSGSSLLLGFLLISNPQKVNVKANLWFGTSVLCIFCLLFVDALMNAKLAPEQGILTFILNFPNFILAPIFYLSVTYYINPTRKWRNKDFLLFGFGFFMIALLIFTLLVKPPEMSDQDFFPKWFQVSFGIIFTAQLLPYFYLSYRKIIKHQKNVRLFSSTLENVDLKWLEYMIIGAVVMAFFWIVNILFQSSFGGVYLNFITYSIYLLGFFFIAYHSVKQKEIYPFKEEQTEEINEIITETEIAEENRKKLLTDEKLAESKEELIELMEAEKPFLDSELSLVKLASLMDVSTHILSYIINNGFDENFYQFINRYRIEEAKKQILNPQMNHLSLLGIGFEVGFNSKTVFNTTFKKYTGQTPSEFKKAA